MNSIAGFILVGGSSRRMGTDKAQLLVAGQTFAQRIAEEMSKVVDSVTLVGRDLEKLHPQLPSVPDVYEKWGALGGVHGALSACPSSWALIVACDLPFVTAALFGHLAALRDGQEAVAPIQNDGLPQPLCALYARTPCLDVADQLIKTGERKPIALLQSVRTRWVPFEELGALTGAQHFFDNVNTPQDYEHVIRKGEVVRLEGGIE
ncbi:MAG: molybdenum cofactor guanylyltransferase [Pyrinomonadaceae bacterium]